MWIVFGFLFLMLIVGLWAAWYNLHDEKGRQFRLEARRIERKNRKKPMWYQIAEAENARRAAEEKKKNES